MCLHILYTAKQLTEIDLQLSRKQELDETEQQDAEETGLEEMSVVSSLVMYMYRTVIYHVC